MPSRLLPGAVAVLIAGVLSADIAVAVNLRADERRAAAAAAEARAVAEYQNRVRPVAERVYDHVQPLQDVADFYLRPSPDALQITLDVYTRSGTRASLVAVRRDIAAVSPPASMRDESRALLVAVDTLVDAATRLEKRPTQHEDMGQLVVAESILGNALLTWSAALTGVYGDRPLPTFPSGGTPRPGIRKPSSRAAWIAAADRVCSASIDSGLALPELETPQQVVAAGPRYAKLLRGTLTGLGTLTAPAADRERLRRDVTPHLETTRGIANALDIIVAAVRTSNASKVGPALTTLADGMRGSQKLSQGLVRYGATVCGEIFEINPEDIPSVGADPGTRT